MKVRKTQWLSNKTRGINIPHLDPILQNCNVLLQWIMAETFTSLPRCRSRQHSRRGNGGFRPDARFRSVKKKHIFGQQTHGIWQPLTYTKLVEKPRIFIQKDLEHLVEDVTLLWQETSVFFFLGGMADDPMGFANFHPPLTTTHPRPSEGDGYWASHSVRRWVGWNPVEAPKDGGCGTCLPNGLYKWFIKWGGDS